MFSQRKMSRYKQGFYFPTRQGTRYARLPIKVLQALNSVVFGVQVSETSQEVYQLHQVADKCFCTLRSVVLGVQVSETSQEAYQLHNVSRHCIPQNGSFWCLVVGYKAERVLGAPGSGTRYTKLPIEVSGHCIPQVLVSRCRIPTRSVKKPSPVRWRT